LFKNLKKNWNNIDTTNIISGIDDLECCFALENVRNGILHFSREMFQNKCFREDYKELIKLSIFILNGNLDKKQKWYSSLFSSNIAK
jgi:hypothetical protein